MNEFGFVDFNATYASVETQVEVSADLSASLMLKNTEQDPIIPWHDELLRKPLVSWATYPFIPSVQLEALVDVFEKPKKKQTN